MDTQSIVLESSHYYCVSDIAFSLDSSRIISCAHDGSIKIWDTQTRQLLKDIMVYSKSCSIAFSPDSKEFATCSNDGTVETWNSHTGEAIDSMQMECIGTTYIITYSSDDVLLAIGTSNYTIKILNINDLEHPKNLVGHKAYVSCIIFNLNKTKLISSSYDCTIKIWNIETQKQELSVPYSTSVSTISISPDENILASGMIDGSINIWNILTQSHIGTISAHVYYVRSISFSLDGSTIVSTSDVDMKLCNLQTLKLVDSLYIPNNTWINRVLYSPDNTMIAFSTRNGSVGFIYNPCQPETGKRTKAAVRF